MRSVSPWRSMAMGASICAAIFVVCLPVLALPASAAPPGPAPPDPNSAPPDSGSPNSAPPDSDTQPGTSGAVGADQVGQSECTTTPCQSSVPTATPPAPGTATAATPTTDNAGSFGAEGPAEEIVERMIGVVSNALVVLMIGDENDVRGGVFGYVIGELIGQEGAVFNPIVSCNGVSPSSAGAADCEPWFVGQLAMLRQFGLWLIVPLAMLATIQAVVRGSLFLIVRAALIMIPAAVIGTVLIAALTQLLLNIADDLTAAMFSFYGDEFASVREGIAAFDDQTLSLFGIVFAIVAALAALVITIEMIIREVGIYITVLFLPLLFAGLVWPVTARWARRLAEVLIALIFSKVFIAGGIALGLGAIEAAGTRGIESQGLLAIANAAAIFIIAAVFGVRMLDWTPLGSEAKAGRLAEPSNTFGMGEFVSLGLGNRQSRINRARGNLQPGRDGFTRS